MHKALFQLEPLGCPSCGKKIEVYLEKQKGIMAVKVLFKLCRVRTEFDESEIDAERIKAAIFKLGYVVKSVKVVDGEGVK